MAGPKPDSGDSEAGRAQIAAAKADVQKAIEVNPGLSLAYNHLGRLLLREDNKEVALTEFDLAVKFGPSDADAYAWQGVVLLRLERYPEAIQAYFNAKKFATSPTILLRMSVAPRHTLRTKNTMRPLPTIARPCPANLAVIKFVTPINPASSSLVPTLTLTRNTTARPSPIWHSRSCGKKNLLNSPR